MAEQTRKTGQEATVECRRCGKTTKRTRAWKHFCSEACRLAWHTECRIRGREVLEREREVRPQ